MTFAPIISYCICGPMGTACWPIDPVLAKGRVTGSTQDEFLPKGIVWVNPICRSPALICWFQSCIGNMRAPHRSTCFIWMYISKVTFKINFDRRKFRSQTSDVWTDAAAVVRRVREERVREERVRAEKVREEKARAERVSRKKIKAREKVEKSKHSVFPMFCGSKGLKTRLAKAAGWSHLAG